MEMISANSSGTITGCASVSRPISAPPATIHSARRMPRNSRCARSASDAKAASARRSVPQRPSVCCLSGAGADAVIVAFAGWSASDAGTVLVEDDERASDAGVGTVPAGNAALSGAGAGTVLLGDAGTSDAGTGAATRAAGSASSCRRSGAGGTPPARTPNAGIHRPRFMTEEWACLDRCAQGSHCESRRRTMPTALVGDARDQSPAARRRICASVVTIASWASALISRASRPAAGIGLPTTTRMVPGFLSSPRRGQ